EVVFRAGGKEESSPPTETAWRGWRARRRPSAPCGWRAPGRWRESAEVVDDAVLSGDAIHRVRLLDFDLEPAPANTACQIQAGGVTFATTLDDEGVATFGVPRSVTTCVAKW